jgi:hypothetical protein
LIVLACVFGGVLFGMHLGKVLPHEHLSPDAKNVIVVSMTMVATVAAVVLGLLIASAQSSLDEKDGELRKEAAQIVFLDQTMAEYGSETADARNLLKQILIARINLIWPEENGAKLATEAIGRGAGAEVVQEKLLALSPKNDAQRWLQSTALQITRDLQTSRWLFVEQIDGTIQWPFLVVLVFWFVIIFAGVGLVAPRNGSVTLVLLITALSVAGSLYVMLEMEQPYRGLIKLSSAPLRTALTELGVKGTAPPPARLR